MTNGNRTTYLPRGSAMSIYSEDILIAENDVAWIELSEHNRSDISIGTERIQQTQRMANGTLRKFFIDDKKQFTVSWRMLPGTRGYTVDGNWGALDLIEFYNSDRGQSTFDIKFNFAKNGMDQSNDPNESETYEVSFISFTANLIKRGEVPFYDISMSLEQV